MSFYRFGDYDVDAAPRREMIERLLEGDEADVDGHGLPNPERLRTVLGELGGRCPDHRQNLVSALTQCSLPARAALRMLEMPDEVLRRVAASPELSARFATIASQSPVSARFLVRNSAWLERGDRLVRELDDQIDAMIEEARSSPEDAWSRPLVAEFMAALRRRRRYAYLDVIEQEATQRSGILATAAKISQIAERSIGDALAFAEAVESAHEVRTVIFGMGKLGGDELNFSSDVDLVFVHEAVDEGIEESDGARIAARVARTTTKLLSEHGSEGCVFRVDLRLRPFGTQGAVSPSKRAFRLYYETHGRMWERAAWIKARVVAGDRRLGESLLSRMEQFVYRRYLDDSAIDELAAMKQSIDLRSGRGATHEPGPRFDLKGGRGGIREVEFFVQALQLIYAAGESDLAVRGTVPVLQRLAERGLIPDGDRAKLEDAYRFLRIAEHRIQMEEERQTHALPSSDVELDKLAWRLGFADRSGLLERLRRHTRDVRGAFADLFPGREEDARDTAWLDIALDDSVATDERIEALRGAGFGRPARMLRELERLASPPEPVLGRHAEFKVEKVARRLVELCAASGFPDNAFVRVQELLSRRNAVTTVVRIVEERPRAAVVMTTLFAISEEFGRLFVRQPEMVETLLADQAAPALDGEALRARIEQALSARTDHGSESRERQWRLERMRYVRQSEEIRIALGEFGGRLDIRKATRALTELAEDMLELTRDEAIADLKGRIPPGSRDRLAALACGKLGGKDLGHAADLDVIFVFDDAPLTVADYARIARKWVSFLSAPMTHGRLYSVDMRLRPDGRQGTVVTTVDSFEAYYHERAWPWERLALVRSRPLAAADKLAERLDAIVESVLDSVDFEEINAEVRRMRVRRIDELAGAVETLDFKRMPGGTADLEWFVQLAQIKARDRGTWRGAREPSSWRALEALAGIYEVTEADAENLALALDFFRKLEVWTRLVQGRETSELPESPRSLRAIEDRVLGDDRSAGDTLQSKIDASAQVVLDAMDKYGLGDL